MGDLADLLVLLHDAHRHVGPVRATLRTWRRPREEMAALERAGATTLYAAIGGPAPEEMTDTVRLWLQPPDRIREERETQTTVRRGELWWTVDAEGDAMTNEDDPEVGGGAGEDAQWLLDPAGLMGALVLTPAGRGEVAGRPTLRARGIPRASDDDEEGVILRIGGGDEYVLDVDAERGALLRVEARAGGAAFLIHEVTEIAFGERFEPAVFELEPPPGQRFRGVLDDLPGTMRDLPIERVAALAPFPVWTPARLPRGWELGATFAPASERLGTAPAVYLHYAAPDASHQLAIHLSPADHPGEHPEYDHADPGPWIDQERDGRRMQVREPAEDWQPAQARLELDGTRILIHSRDLDASWLADLAGGLVRAPTSPPRFA